jgi:F0F1-type ATP synthase assembly protein I
VFNSAAAGRRLASRAVAYQLAVVVLAALAFLVQGLSAAVAVAVGGLGVVLGGALAANVALGGGVVLARSALLRLVLGTCIKWAVAITIFAMALGVGRMAPLPLLAGFAVALIAHPLILNLLARVERER